MRNNILDTINNYLNFIDEYNYIKDLYDISFKIGKIIAVLNLNDIHKCDVLCNEIVSSTDFENIEIRPADKRNMSVVQRIKSNCFYLIERLTLLAFNKISKHELGKEIDRENKELSVIYKSLDLALKNKNNKE